MRSRKVVVGELRAGRSIAGFAVAIGLLAFATFVVVTAEFVVVGLLPAMATDLGVSVAQAGVYVTSFALAAALLGPPLTMAAGRCEPGHVLVAATLIFAAGNLAVALIPSHSVVVGMRLVQGCILPAFVSVSIAAAARLAGDGREGWASSLVNIGVVAATVLGIPAGAWVAEAGGWPAAFASLALLGFASAGSLAILFPRMRSVRPTSLLSEASLLWRPAFLGQLLLSGVLFAGMFVGYTYIAALLGAITGLRGEAIGWMLMLFGAAGVIGNWIAGRVVDRDPLGAIAAVAIALPLVMGLIGLLKGSPMLVFVAIVPWGAAHTAAFVFCQTIALMGGRETPAFAMSLNISVCNVGIAVGSLAGGSIVDVYGVEAVGYGGAALTAAALVVAVSMMVHRSRQC